MAGSQGDAWRGGGGGWAKLARSSFHKNGLKPSPADWIQFSSMIIHLNMFWYILVVILDFCINLACIYKSANHVYSLLAYASTTANIKYEIFSF